ncbi:MAG: hypothetical protein HY543_07230, partial [Deltaproteobacteria bacterium]|nr:hypothetical protein [Deltaproteobacteria bacterium]
MSTAPVAATSAKNPFARLQAAAREGRPATIVALDSGLGGMAVAASVYERLSAANPFSHAQVAFVNVLPAWEKPAYYNSLRQRDPNLLVQVLNRALMAIEERFRPDLVLIACNTLSVYHPQTEHAKGEGGNHTVTIVDA